jgi:hypothetical protein
MPNSALINAIRSDWLFTIQHPNPNIQITTNHKKKQNYKFQWPNYLNLLLEILPSFYLS